MKIGSEAHKELFCQSFMNSHLTYEPQELPWPKLDDATLARIRGIPFWAEAQDIEKSAGVMVSSFAATVSDRMIREAIALQGIEEARHSRVIEFLINHYGVETPVRPAVELPQKIEPAFVRFGYGECFDSFFAFGLFGLARKSDLFPEQFFTIFDPILDEEARHMVFFANWIAYHLVNQGLGARVFRGAHSVAHYIAATWRRLDSFRTIDTTDDGSFNATGASLITADLTLEKFLTSCLEENERRMSVYDQRLLRPQLLPHLATAALGMIKLLPKQQSSTKDGTARLAGS